MNTAIQGSEHKITDRIQQRLTNYAWDMNYDALPREAIHAAKVRIIDTLGALIGGFYGEPCRIARAIAAQVPDPDGATVLGTRIKTAPDMCAFVNATTARYAEVNDIYRLPGANFAGHPSDVITPVLAVAEHTRASGREFITNVVLAYEVTCRICDVFNNRGFDNTNFCCLAIAVAAGRMYGLAPAQLSHCISMAVVPNGILKQVRTAPLSMWKAVGAGQAGKAGVFAAILARAGMEGPHLPFEGKAGWCKYIANQDFTMDTMGGDGTRFRILDTVLRHRAAPRNTISAILAAEKIARVKNEHVKHVTVEVYQRAKERAGTGEERWNPDSRETADHSIPYLVAATLLDGGVSPNTFSDAHLWNAELRALMQKVEIIENKEFTQAYAGVPREHRARITLVTSAGEQRVGEAGGDDNDLAEQMSDTQVAEKFRGLTEDYLGPRRVDAILDGLWHLDQLSDVAGIPSTFIL